MAITSSDIKMYLSGGSGNTDPDSSLGGVISTTEVVTDTIENLFDNTTPDEAEVGDTEYRCVYIKNGHGTLTYSSAVVYMQSLTPSTDSSIEIGVGTSSMGGTEQTVADENTAPTGVTFISGVGTSNTISIGNITAGSHQAIWVKRIISALASSYTNDNTTLVIKGTSS